MLVSTAGMPATGPPRTMPSAKPVAMVYAMVYAKDAEPKVSGGRFCPRENSLGRIGVPPKRVGLKILANADWMALFTKKRPVEMLKL